MRSIGPSDDTNIYSEFDIFPEGLPDVDDIRVKKRKNEDEKFIFESCRNPPNSQIDNQNSTNEISQNATPIKALTKLHETSANFELDVDEFVLD